MSIPSLTRKQSSLAALIEQERNLSGQNRETRDKVEQETQPPLPTTRTISTVPADNQGGDTDIEEGDTDIEEGDTDIEEGDTDIEDDPPASLQLSLSRQKTFIIREDDLQEASTSKSPLRMSSRLMSMKRRGKVVLLKELTNEFEFNAGDILTVRGEDDDFYVCRVLEDVPVLATSFRVAWYNRVEPNLYEVSFDDVCDMKCVITRVKLDEKDGKFSLPHKCIKQTKRLLREALAEERGEQLEEQLEEEDEGSEEEEEEEEEDEEEQPPAKRTRSSGSISTPSPRKGKKGKPTSSKKTATPKKGKAQKRKAPTPKKPKKVKPEKKKVRRAGVLIPNDDIELIDVDPTFETREDFGLMSCKTSIQAVLLNDMNLLKECIDNIKEIHTVHWNRSADVRRDAIQYALLKNNREAVDVLFDDLIEPKKNRCGPPNISLNEMDTGSYNFYTFGHAVRQIYASRGSREGNNAFLKEEKQDLSMDDYLSFCLKKGDIPFEMVEFVIDKYINKQKTDLSEAIENVWQAIRSGNRKVAGYLVMKAIEKDGFGFNFLHKEVLVNETEPLSKFRSPSVKKKPYMCHNILPLHAACINPNSRYLKDLLNVVPECNIPDSNGYKLIHYACACEGSEPLKVLLTRGVDPNDLGPKAITPLMIAAKYGRDENVKTLLASDNTTEEEEDDDDEVPGPRIIVDTKCKSAKAAIHYAASAGHVDIIRTLVAHGSNINLQTGAAKANVTALMIGAMKGNLDLVKTCVELGGGADKQGKWKMTALMHAAKNGHSPVVAYLLRLGVNPNAADSSGNTPVHYAAAYGWLHCLQLLIKAGANPNTANQWKTTALALSMMKDHIKITDYLLSLKDCDVNFKDDNGQTLLAQMIGKRKVDNKLKSRVIYLVEEKGADVKEPDIQGWTPLHHLAANSIYTSPGSIKESRWLGIASEEQETSQPDPTSDEEEEEEDESQDMDSQDNDQSQESDGGSDNNDGEEMDNQPSESSEKNEDDGDNDSEENFQSFQTFGRYVRPPPKLIKSRAEVSCYIVEVLLKAGADLDAIDEKGQTPLMIALLQHNYPLIQKLIDLGAKPSVGQNEQGQQLIHIQANKKDKLDLREMYPKVMEPPLEGTVQKQLEAREKFLEKLVNRTNTDMLKLFIAGSAEISATDKSGLTPLMVAFSKNNVDMIEVLLANNADPSMGVEDTGHNILHLLNCVDLNSRSYFASKMAQLIPDEFTRKNVANAVDNNGFTPLLHTCEMYACHCSNDEEVEKSWSKYIQTLIKDFGCDATACVEKFKTGDKVQREKVESLGFKDDEKDIKEYVVTGKFSCLHFLVYRSYYARTLQILLKHLHGNTDVINSCDRYGRTPLHFAVLQNNSQGVEELLKSGADVNAIADDKDHFSTPLILACKPTLKLDIAKSLLKWNANPDLVDKLGRSALSYAVSNEPDSDGSSLKLVRALLEDGADVNSADHKDRTVLHYAVNQTTGGFETLTDVEDLLLQHRADTTRRDFRGRIPLHYAFVKIGRHLEAGLSDPVSISSVIVEAMADQTQDITDLINHADDFGQTLLHRAAIRGATLCILHLVKKGANVDLEDKDSNTALSLALRQGHNSCAMSLVQLGTKPHCNVITPVTEQQLKDYEKEKKQAFWIWNELNNLQVPKAIIKAAFHAVVEQNWQGVAYLMLDVAGLDFIVALRAVLCAKKVDLAWTLIRKQKKDVCVQGIDDKGRNILHLLALHIVKDSDVVEKIAVHVLQRGVSPSSLDKEGAIPLHYAACNGNKRLCELLLRYNPSTINVAHPSGITPFAGCFDPVDLTSRHRLIDMFVKAKPKTLDVCYKVGRALEDEAMQETTTPLIEASIRKDEWLLDVLLTNNANVNFAKDNGRTPLMEVVRANMEDIAKVLLYGTVEQRLWKGDQTNVDLSARDNKGKTVIHHCVQSREYGSSENVALLCLLAKFGAPLDVRDNSGKTPLDYAMKQQSGKIKQALMDFMGNNTELENGAESMETDEELGFQFTSTIDAFWEGPEPDIDADSEAMLAEAKAGDEEPDWDPSKPPPVDCHASVENGEVHVDPSTGVPYDILMTKVDVKYGMFGLNVFYKMQVVHHKGKDLWVLLNRWGRIGDSGQHQRTPFHDPNEATSEFRKIFKSKTGNSWEDKDNFQKMPKKYALVLPKRNPELKRKKFKEVLSPFDLEKCPPSRLPKELQKLMKNITDVQSMKEAMDHFGYYRIDQAYMPFGRLSTDTINKARDILLKIKDILSGIDRNNLKGSEEKFEQVVELSNSYYMVIPMSNYAFETIRPLNDSGDVNKHLVMLMFLTELAFVSKLLLAAQYRAKEMNPLDYCYRALGTHVELMDCNSDECQLILKYIHNSANRTNVDVKAIYRISRPVEKQYVASCGVQSNHRLLWHGTKTAYVLGILKEGLRIEPHEVIRTGSSLGKGIYFSDSLEKSLGYSDLSDYGRHKQKGYVLLSQVALGSQSEFSEYNYTEPITAPLPNHDSVWLTCRKIPDPSHDVTTPYGSIVPAGPFVTNVPLVEKYKNSWKQFPPQHNEYVVYNEAQVQQRYLVKLTKKSRF